MRTVHLQLSRSDRPDNVVPINPGRKKRQSRQARTEQMYPVRNMFLYLPVEHTDCQTNQQLNTAKQR